MISKKDAAACERALRHLLLHEQTPFPPDTDWDKISAIMSAHRMDSMLECAEDPALQALRRPEAHFGHVLYRRSLHQTLKALTEEMERRGIRAAVMKGVVLEDCYPPEVVRNSGDIDLYLPGSQREAFSAMMRDMGITLVSDINDSQDGVDVYHTPGNIEVEAHFIIYQFFTARQLRIMRKLGCFSAEGLVPFSSDVSCYTLKPEDHLIYQLYHTSKHAMRHDMSYRMLTDLTMFVNRYADSIDWEKTRQLVRELNMTRASDALMGYCIRHLGMRPDCWPDAGRRMEWLMRLSLTSPVPYRWERFQQRTYWPFYTARCVEQDGKFYTVRHYRPAEALKRKYLITTFLFWRIIRVLWKTEIDHSDEIA